jgi:signal transduction histidine kinase
LWTPPLFAQNTRADSLLRALREHPQEDTLRVRMLYDYSAIFFPGIPDSTFKYSELGYRLSLKLNYPYGKMRGLNGMGLKLWITNQLNEAIFPYQQALSIANKIRNAQYQIKIANNIGVLYQSTGLIDSAQKYYLYSLKIAEETGDQKMQAKSYSDLGTIAGLKGDYLLAVKYLIKALGIYESQGDLPNRVITHIRLGNQYLKTLNFQKSRSEFLKAQTFNDSIGNKRFALEITANLGLLYCQVKKDFDSARVYLYEAEKMAIELEAQDVILTVAVNLGNIFYHEKKFESALHYFLQAYNNPLLNVKRYERVAILVNLGSTYLQIDDFTKSQMFLLEGLKLAQEYTFQEFEAIALQSLSDLMAERGKFKEAFDYLKKAKQLSDTLFREDLKQQIAEAEYQFRLEKQEAQNQFLQEEVKHQAEIIAKQRMFVAVGLIIIFIISVLLFLILSSRSRRIKAELELRKLNDSLEHLVLERTQQLEMSNEDLASKNKELEEFTYLTTHDLQEPFHTLSSYTQLLHDEYADKLDPTASHYLVFIHDAASRMREQLKGLLEYSFLGKNSPLVIVDCQKLVKEVLDEMGPVIVESDAVIQVGLLPVIQGYEKELKVLFHNLIDNALKFKKKDAVAEISIASGNLPKGWSFSICDNGIGIEAKDKEKVFVIFKRMQNRSEYPGTGIGLAQCQKIVWLHGGKIWVESEVGKGSCFRFTIAG